MAENGNRGPNDFRSRNGKRRREPPIIDASATEVPLETTAPADPEGAAAEPAADPVLFGGARRAPEAERAVPAEGGELAPAEPTAATAVDAPAEPGIPETGAAETAAASTAAEEPAAAAAVEPATEPPVTASPFPAAEPVRSAEPATASPPVLAASRPGGGAAWLLGLSNLVLLAVLAWTLYTAPQRDGHAEIAALGTKVAALEARPDPAGVQNGVAALDKRLGAADADRAALGKAVAGLNTRLDAVAQQAQSAKADADRAAGAAQADAGKAPPTGAAAAATVGALAAVAARVDGVDRSVSTLSADQKRTATAVADLPKPVPPDFGPTDAKIAGLESQLSGKVAALDGRLTALDGKVNGSDARLNGFDAKVNAVDGKINGFDARMNGFEARTNALESRDNETAAGLGRLQAAVAGLPKVDLSPLQAATGSLDKRVGTIEGELSASKDAARATPIALVGEAVERAIADGRPYAADLDTLKALGAEPDALAALRPLAATGAPTAAALKDRWDAVSPDVLRAVKPAQTGSALDRFAASARALVQVRQVGAVEGDDPGALVNQVDVALDAGDVAGALAAWNKLPQAGRDRSKDWAAAAKARVEAAGAAQGLVGRAVATLGRTKG